MALYWHPYLAELLRQDYGDRLIVEEEVLLGDMPLRADLLLVRRDPHIALPFPFCFLGAETLVEYKSPDDWADQEDLATLEVYGMLYLLRKKIVRRKDVTLWLAASHFASNVSQEGGAYLSGAQEIGPGVKSGTLDGFPTFFVDLNRLPFAPEALPLLMVAKGPQERQLVEFLVDHSQEYPVHLQLLRELHVQKLEEVLNMRQLTPEQIGIDYEALLRLLGEKRAMELIGEERAMELIGEERAMELIGEERLLELLGEERVRAWLEQRQQPKPKDNGEADSSIPSP